MANKTQMTRESVDDFLASIEPARKAEEAQRLDQLFRDVTGYAPRMWGASIIGYGQYR